jgi:hypothetical protein
MKKILLIIIAIIISGGFGFITGKSVGYDSAKMIQKYRSIESIKSELELKEKELISKFLKGSAEIERKDVGGLFKTKYVKYFTGKIRNTALIAKAKDVKIKVTYLSKTNAEIGNSEFTIYEFIEPGKSKSFKKKINVSEDVAEFKWSIIESKSE